MRAPERLRPEHNLSLFENGKHPALDDWLRLRALVSEGLSARTYVIGPDAEPDRVAGYYALSSAQAERVIMPTAKLRKAMPEHVPLLLIGRLAVDKTQHGKGLGVGLLIDGLRRCVAAAQLVGVRAIVAHAIDDDAVAFYLKHYFLLSPLGARTVVLPIESALALVGD
ncbi:MAG: GNAT family N-acetyltransferase [Alphaproteobacteria bacterium]|nr:GNAT family N-acetyltransferase [Alphaproteobacteria bacterium]